MSTHRLKRYQARFPDAPLPTVDAIQYAADGSNADEVIAFHKVHSGAAHTTADVSQAFIFIVADGASLLVHPGHWLVFKEDGSVQTPGPLVFSFIYEEMTP
jgi:hypothetical protein